MNGDSKLVPRIFQSLCTRKPCILNRHMYLIWIQTSQLCKILIGCSIFDWQVVSGNKGNQQEMMSSQIVAFLRQWPRIFTDFYASTHENVTASLCCLYLIYFLSILLQNLTNLLGFQGLSQGPVYKKCKT